MTFKTQTYRITTNNQKLTNNYKQILIFILNKLCILCQSCQNIIGKPQTYQSVSLQNFYFLFLLLLQNRYFLSWQRLKTGVD